MPGEKKRETASARPSGHPAPDVPPLRAGVSFLWPADGVVQATSLPGGGCDIKITFAEKGIVKSIGRGRIVQFRHIPTKRIAQHYEILVQHDDDIESSYSIVDQSPNLPAAELRHLAKQGAVVEMGSELYVIGNGGFLHFQLSHAGKLVDPRKYMHQGVDGSKEVIGQPPET